MGLFCPKWVCPDQGGSVLSKVGLPSKNRVYSVLSGSVLLKKGLSSLRWVCPVHGGTVLFKVGLSSPKWICPVQGGDTLIFDISELRCGASLNFANLASEALT